MPNKQPQGLNINRFVSGLVTQRNPLVPPYSFVGLSRVDKYDALIDGQNTELTNSNTIARRPGFPTYCSQTFGSSEWPLGFYTFRKNDGTITDLVDTQTNVYSFTASTLTSLYTKTTTQQSAFQSVGSSLYWCDGTAAKKLVGGTVTKWGIAAPAIGAALSFGTGTLNPLAGYRYVYAYKNSSTGHVSTASPQSVSTLKLVNKNVAVTGDA